ncbi:sensor histidine kinase [Streptomyces sp. NPDC054765]
MASISGRAAWLPGIFPLRTQLERHPLLTDAVLAVALFLTLSNARFYTEGGHPIPVSPTPVLAHAVICALVVPRRRYPLSVFAAMCTVVVVQEILNFPSVYDPVILVGLYTVAAHCAFKMALAAVAVLEAGLALTVFQVFPVLIAATLFIFLSGLLIAALGLGAFLRTRRDYLTALEDRAARAEAERDQQVRIAAARERARIAREMHDIVAHNLSVMIALADGAAFAARAGSADAEAAARQASDTGRRALTEMHRVLGLLREADSEASHAPQPGIEQVDELLTQVRGAGLAASLTVTGEPFPVLPTAGLAVYRLIQEALTNVLKHAQSPTAAKVVLRYADPGIEVGVTDDGRGAPTPERAGGGHGLTGMRERVGMFNGQVEAEPQPGGGWRVHARLDSCRAGTPDRVAS